MRQSTSLVVIVPFFAGFLSAQQPLLQQQTTPPPSSNLAFIRDTYTKFEYKVAMRDGVKLFTSVYIPKDVFTDGKTYPVMMSRTPYSVRPYGADQYPENL